MAKAPGDLPDLFDDALNPSPEPDPGPEPVAEEGPAEARASDWAFDPIDPARGKSVQLQSILNWRDASRDTPYLSKSLRHCVRLAAILASPVDRASGQPTIIDAQMLLTGLQVLARHSKISPWAINFQNDVLGQDVLPPGYDTRTAGALPKQVQLEDEEGLPVEAILQWDAVEVLAEASRLRLATNTGFTQIGVRHLAAGYFLTQAGQAALREQGLLGQYEALRGRMADVMERTLGERYGDAPEAWPPVIARVRAAPLLVRLRQTTVRPDYAPDVVSAEGPDPLGAASDARALADVILLKAARPPLAIGLFGPWGSGKSTLMRRLQAEIRTQLDDERAHPSGGDDLGRVRNALQIEFSAWSFADSENLWAALTAEIFDQLAAGGMDGWRDKPRADLVGSIAARLSLEAAALNTASAKAAEHEQTADRLEKAVRTAQAQKAKAGREAAWSLLGDVLSAADAKAKDEKAKDGKADEDKAGGEKADKDKDAGKPEADQWTRTRDAFLASPGGDGAAGVAGTLKALRVVGPASLQLTWRDSAGIQRWVAAGLALVFFGLAGWALLDGAKLSPGWLSAFGAFTLAAPYMAAGVRLLSRFLTERGKLRSAAAAAEAEAKAALARAKDDLAAAQQRAETSRAFVATFQSEGNAPAAPGLMLKYLLRESEDLAIVRKQIGLINVVRRCFEQLAAIIRDMSKSDDAGAIDRIVIYIDDLDRCSAKQVVAVLEAIHLLLAFDCFVVVVAVDPKWLAYSLNQQHRQLSGGGPDDDTGRAAPEDYLEKIFQLALQVRPLSARGATATSYPAYRDFAVSLLEPDAARAGTIESREPERTAEPAPDQTRIDLRKGFTIALPNRPEDFDALRLERVSLGPDEQRLLLNLGGLAAKSPRAVKRMINVYRLIRISHAEALDAFLDKAGGGDAKYWAVLFALACEIGLPAGVMTHLSRGVRRGTDGEWESILSAIDLMPSTGAETSMAMLPEDLTEFARELDAAGLAKSFTEAWAILEEHVGRSVERHELIDGLDAVGRYSFRSLQA